MPHPIELGVLGALLCFGAAACEIYTPGSYLANHREPWSQGRRLGCVDIALEVMNDPRVSSGGALLDVSIGNRCERAVRVDMRHLDAEASWSSSSHVGGTSGGTMEPLTAYDPRHEIGPKLLGPRSSGHEGIELDPSTPRDNRPTRLCVHLRGVVDETNEDGPLCFVDERGSWIPEMRETAGGAR